MNFTMQWIKEPIIFAFTFSGIVTEHMLNAMGKEGCDLAEAGQVYPIVDLSEVKKMPANLINTVFRSIALLDFIGHQNTRVFIFIQPDKQTRLMIDTVFRNKPYKVVDTLKEAERVLLEEIIPYDT